MEAGIWGFIGVLVGAASSIVTTVMVAKNSRLLQLEASSLERSEIAREFQRTNLIELQDRLSKQVSSTMNWHTEKKRDGWLSKASLKEYIISTQSITILTERIADESLRVMVWRVTNELFSIVSNTTMDTDDPMEIILNVSKEAREEIGAALRSLY